MNQKAKLLLLAFFIILLDQISKSYALEKWQTFCNKGIAFGISLSGNVGVLVATVTLSLIFYLIIRERKFLSQAAFSLIFAGGVSNLFDRLTLGCVRDFIKIPFWPSLTWLSPSLTRWPSFNLADAAITIGVLLLIFSVFRNFPKKDD